MARYWFRPKSYGFGATPITWEGWAISLAVAAVVAGSAVMMTVFVDRADLAAWLIWAAFVAGITFWLVRVSRRRTEGEWRWRWGEDSLRPKH